MSTVLQVGKKYKRGKCNGAVLVGAGRAHTIAQEGLRALAGCSAIRRVTALSKDHN